MWLRPRFIGGLSILIALTSTLPLGGAGQDVQIEMRNVHLHTADGIILDISNLRGTMVSRTAGAPPVFDDRLC